MPIHSPFRAILAGLRVFPEDSDLENVQRADFPQPRYRKRGCGIENHSLHWKISLSFAARGFNHPSFHRGGLF
jgi:hypothetical protein